MFLWRRNNSQNHSHDDSEEKDAKVQKLKEALGSLSDLGSKYCTEPCLWRYLEARNWDVEKAKKMLQDSLKWREIYKPEQILWSDVAQEGETGKIFRADFHDRLGRPVLIMRPGMQNSSSAEGNVRHFVYLMENVAINLPEGQEQTACLVDFSGYTLNTKVSLKASVDVVKILQNHYPERLSVTFLYNPPKFYQTFFKALSYFMDQKTVEKARFVYPKNKDSIELMKTFFDMDNLPSELGGKSTLTYNHEEFSRLMAQDDVKRAKFWGFY